MSDNFSCFDANLSHDSVTDEAWSLKSENQRDGVIFISTVLLLYMVVGIPWNILILVALVKDKFYKQPSTFLLFNLALVDLLTSALVMPFLATPGLSGGVYKLGNSDYQRCQTCYAGVILIICFLYVSVHLLALMSVDRLIYIARPLHYDKSITVPCMAVTIVVIWIVCLILSIPPLFQLGVVEFSVKVGSCVTVFNEVNRLGKSYFYIFLLVLEVMVPLGVLVVANIWLICILRRESTKRLEITQVSNSIKTSEINRLAKKKYTVQQLRMVKVFGSIFVSNLFTWAPAIVVIFAVIGAGSDKVPAGVYGLVYLSFLSQSVIHPMLESCLVGTVRKLAKKVCYTYSRRRMDVTKISNTDTKIKSTTTD